MRQSATALKEEGLPPLLIWRDVDAAHINEILNHPEVRPWVADAGEGALDMTPLVDARDNVLLSGAYGCCMFLYVMPGTYEVHSQCVPKGRGRWMAAFAQEAVRWMFTKTPACEILTRVPGGHAAARALTVATGFVKEFSRIGECKFFGETVDADVYRLSIMDWAEGSAWAEESGKIFHRMLQAEAKRLGILAPAHPDDPQHNRVVGAAVEMVRGGFLLKGVVFYDRWAYLARHAPISVVANNPPTIKMDIGILKFLPDGIEVSKC